MDSTNGFIYFFESLAQNANENFWNASTVKTLWIPLMDSAKKLFQYASFFASKVAIPLVKTLEKRSSFLFPPVYSAKFC